MGQHYLSKCYLNEFCGIDKQFYTLNINAFRHGKIPKPKLRRPVDVCHEKNYYTIDAFNYPIAPELRTSQKLAVEESFHWYENSYPGILKKIKNRKSLSSEDAYTLAYALFDFKIRNKFWRENTIERQKDSLIKNNKTDYLNDPEILKRFDITKELALSVVEMVHNQMLNEPTFSKQLHLSSFLDKARTENSIQHRIVTNLLGLKWHLAYSVGGRFITSDNPGYCIDENEVVYNTRFAPGFIFTMPLTPQLCLFIDDSIPDERFIETPAIKFLEYREISDVAIDMINKASAVYINRYLISGSKEILLYNGENLRNQIK